MTEPLSIEAERVVLLEAWGRFRVRLAQQRGGRKLGVQQSLLPMLREMLLEVKQGFSCRELLASASFGRAYVWVSQEEGEKTLVAGGTEP